MLFNLFKNGKSISPKEVYESLEKDKSVILLDVREGYEYKNGHIKGAKLLPVGEISIKLKAMNIPKDKKIIVYCQSGARSARACSMLEAEGYEQVYNLGGISSWPYEVVR